MFFLSITTSHSSSEFNAPADGLGKEINEQGVAFYNNLIDFMIEKGVTSFTKCLQSYYSSSSY
jgi:dimeric dUTPase (all-alpha-NTP-PPase superfamily)